MPAAALAHAALSAAAVGLLLTTLRRAGPRAGGLAAAIPINSMPALFWLSLERGGGYATFAVLGSLWGTGLTVLLGAIFARMALALHASAAALLAWLATAAVVLLTWDLSPLPAAVAVLVVCAILLGRALLPRLPACDARRRAGKRTGVWLSMATAAGMSLVVMELSRHSGPQLCGLVAAIPLVGMIAAYAGYRQGGAAVMLRVIDGYLDGMAAKAAFLGALGVGWMLGADAWAWPMGLATAAFTLLAQHRLRRRAPDTRAIYHRQGWTACLSSICAPRPTKSREASAPPAARTASSTSSITASTSRSASASKS